MSQENDTKRRQIRRKKKQEKQELERSWRNRPLPEEYERNFEDKWRRLIGYGHDYFNWVEEHYQRFHETKKRHVRARFNRKWQRKPQWKNK